MSARGWTPLSAPNLDAGFPFGRWIVTLRIVVTGNCHGIRLSFRVPLDTPYPPSWCQDMNVALRRWSSSMPFELQKRIHFFIHNNHENFDQIFMMPGVVP